MSMHAISDPLQTRCSMVTLLLGRRLHAGFPATPCMQADRPPGKTSHPARRSTPVPQSQLEDVLHTWNPLKSV